MLRPGDTHTFSFRVTEARTVPQLLTEAPEFADIPAVFATGYLVAVVEWTAVQHLNSHLNEGETSVGTRVDLTHEAPTAVGMTVTVEVEVTEATDRTVSWSVVASDEAGIVSRGTHTRGILDRERFERGIAKRAASLA